MTRDTAINVLLIIAGIALAILLFGAGAYWKSKSTPKRPSQLTETHYKPVVCRTAAEMNSA